MEPEDLYSQLCAYAVPSSFFSRLHLSSALAVASARIHYNYLNKWRKNCINMKVFLKNSSISYIYVFRLACKN